jgi:Tfp pilus assembly protein PilO
MNLSAFKKLSKEKRQHLVLVGLITAGAFAALGPFRFESIGFGGLISYQMATLESTRKKTADAQKEYRQVQDAVKHADQTEKQVNDARKALTDAEGDIASGDLYAWVVNTLRQFKSAYKVEIPQFLPINTTSDVNLIPGFPYKQASMSVSGTAHYHELGRFIADLENQFPHIRIQNLNIDLNSTPSGDPETLAFRMDIVTLVKNPAS